MTMREKLQAYLEADHKAYLEEGVASYYMQMAESAQRRAERAHKQAEAVLLAD